MSRPKPKFKIDDIVKNIDSNEIGIVKGLAFYHHEDMYRYNVKVSYVKYVEVKILRENQLEKL